VEPPPAELDVTPPKVKRRRRKHLQKRCQLTSLSLRHAVPRHGIQSPSFCHAVLWHGIQCCASWLLSSRRRIAKSAEGGFGPDSRFHGNRIADVHKCNPLAKI